MESLPDLQTVALRLGLIGVALVAWFATQRMIGERRLAEGVVYDHLHVMTGRWNQWLNRSPRAANAILIASSLCVDLVTLFVLIYAVFGPSFKPFLGLLALFVLRQLAQATSALPVPKGIIWRDPGCPSLFVTYGVSNDLFFSGHTALAVYGAMQLAALDIPALTALGVVVAILQVIAVLALRAHWTMDVLAGVLAALTAGLLVARW